MPKELRIYKTRQGKEPFSEWLNKLKDVAARARIRARLDRLAVGHYGDCKSITKDIKELRLTLGPFRAWLSHLFYREYSCHCGIIVWWKQKDTKKGYRTCKTISSKLASQ